MRYEPQCDDFPKKPEVEALMQLGDQILAEMKITDSPQRDLFTVQEYARVLTHLRHAKRPPKFGVDLGDCLEEARLTVGVRQLWTIERSFRTNKHDLRIRPIFHWKPSRIRAHLAICYLAFVCVQQLEYRLRQLGYPMSPDR